MSSILSWFWSSPTTITTVVTHTQQTTTKEMLLDAILNLKPTPNSTIKLEIDMYRARERERAQAQAQLNYNNSDNTIPLAPTLEITNSLPFTDNTISKLTTKKNTHTNNNNSRPLIDMIQESKLKLKTVLPTQCVKKTDGVQLSDIKKKLSALKSTKPNPRIVFTNPFKEQLQFAVSKMNGNSPL